MQAILGFGIGDGGVHHRLLVARLIVTEAPGVLLERLADTGDIAMSENPPATGEKGCFNAVALDVLVRQKQDKRLGGGQFCHEKRLLAGGQLFSQSGCQSNLPDIP